MKRVLAPIMLFCLCFLLGLFAAYLLLWDGKSSSKGGEKPCRKRSFGQDSFVCVCNAEYCDQPEPFADADLDGDQMVFYVSSKAEHRLSRFVVQAEEEEEDKGSAVDFTLQVAPSQQFQSILGFGGAFTDSVGLSVKGLNDEAKQQLLSAYFDPLQGIGFSLGRVPIGASDFSARGYTYLDTPNDFNLSTFALEREDLEGKIPLILAASRLTSKMNSLKLLASPWSAPAWMKSNGELRFGGELKGELEGPFYRAYAQYLLRFFEEYAARGVQFWAMSIQNEPSIAEMPTLHRIPSMFISNFTQRDFARQVLSPLLKQSQAGREIKLLAGDDMRVKLLPTAEEIYSDPEKAEAIDGLAVHWYGHGPFEDLSKVHEMQPDKLILSTEACSGVFTGPALGDWWRGWLYGWDVLNSLKHWAIGWIDWNLWLDERGGPNWVGNEVDAAVIVNASAGEFYKQPMFYFLAHFSRFIPRGSIRIGSTLKDPEGNVLEDTFEGRKIIVEKLDNMTYFDPSPSRHQPEHVAFLTPDGHIVLVLINQGQRNATEVGEARNVRIEEEGNGKRHWLLSLQPDSIVTAIWRRKK